VRLRNVDIDDVATDELVETFRQGVMLTLHAGAVGRSPAQPLVILCAKKESKDVPSPQAQRSNSQSPIIANIASVIAAS
jgi:hypothetical protein